MLLVMLNLVTRLLRLIGPLTGAGLGLMLLVRMLMNLFWLLCVLVLTSINAGLLRSVDWLRMLW